MAQPERKSMDAAILVDSISDILKCSLAPPATRLSAKDLQQFQNHLEGIRDMVQKANNNINSQDSYVLAWLLEVKEVVNDLEDLIEVLRHKESATANATRSLIKASQNMAHRLKVTHHVKKASEELKRFLTEAQNLSFSKEARNIERKLLDTVAKFENTLVAVGRENVKKEIINQLKQFVNSGGDGVVPVVTIVGVPGIGKTKLASLVCEDEQVKAHFGEQIWVHGNRETLDVESIATPVAGTVKKGNRFLLVLDDLRDENVEECLHKLRKRLTEAVGAILITTRSNFVANYKIAGTVKLYALRGLNQEESWSLFQQIREQGSSNHINESVEREKVKEYCGGGVPMKIITIARLLNCSESPLSEAVLKEEFLQELKFTYYHQLPMHQKLCYVYCSLFPQDYVIDAEKLIHLWMAEGFLSRNLCSDPQEFGWACFNDFVPFVFEETGRDEFGVVKSYKMNRLMHELARIVAWDENIVVDSDGKRVHERVVRASFDFALDVQCGIPEALFEKAKKLRTILLLGKTNKSRLPHEVKMATSTCDKIFDTFKCFRVLDLHDLGIKMVPSSIGELKHLRYLDLSHNNIEKLPSSITKLVHLQTLKLSQCHVLKELPKDLEDLSCLMHLYLEGCLDLTHMPRGIGKLSSLQTLSLFVPSKNHHMGDLKDLNSLRGNLEILHLERLKLSASDEKDKYVRDKKHLNCLTLRWDHEEEEEEEEEEKDKGNDVDHKDGKSLECLEPNPNLKVLCVLGYYGNRFSDWLSSMQCLVKFSLNDCPKCVFIPPLDHLPHLRVLELRRLDSLEFISADAKGSSSFTFFPSLKELTISDCPNLKSWWETPKRENDRPFFNCISKLHVQCCPNLDCMPLYPFLDEELVLVDSSVKSMRDTVHAKTSKDFIPFSKLKSMLIARITETPPPRWLKSFISLENLQIRDCSELECLPEGFKSLSSLQRLTIEGCPKLDLDVSKTEWEGLKHLKCLTIREIPKLKSLPWGVEDVTSLEELELYECPALTFLPESMAKLTSLCKLVISECKNLGSLPKGLEMLESLNTLTITDCPLLLPRCQPETGDDWPQIGHVRNILLKQNSQALRDLWSQGRTG
ncbi:disease resistance protein RGA2-like [Glycine soja]|uniref:Putative disease resistance protein RGA4 isoform A n=1 Tax=Glycine soja TaxID=3848 RepID=A0A445LXC4_GLYSO|nr:disease resistance protein RGA2-like [Glycine soja]KHN40424.1 Putative disease resistance protein RGA4 [Glycine soja]RZC27912.1 putative disease resistance protein RGA4 isoform A [Glycine soja]RZC27913.1 putative disease resistance protein RGA4 isoform B [Glycine soja]